jgi:hypothetical protein
MFFCGLYVFYPYDAPSIAFISLSLSFIFRKELIYAFFCFIIAGLFRESSFHILIFVGVWAFVDKSYPYKTRFAWVALFFLIFVLQYKVIRYFYPGPITSVGNIIFDLNQLIFGKGFWSLTTIITLSLAFLLVRSKVKTTAF